LQLGIDDPERWLANADPRVVRTWMAYWQLEPWGMPWHKHASMMMFLQAMCSTIVGMWASKASKAPKPEMQDWMPSDWSPDPKAKPSQLEIAEKMDAFVKATSR
jgi:hypothetical protein